jgi:hypothetical protein
MQLHFENRFVNTVWTKIVNGWITEKSRQFPAREKVLPLFISVDAESGYLPTASVSGVLSPESTAVGA